MRHAALLSVYIGDVTSAISGTASVIVSSAAQFILRTRRISGVLPPANRSLNCNINTGGSCTVFPCDRSRNAVCDFSNKCVCAMGLCATVKGTCVRLADDEAQQLLQPAIGASMKMVVLKLPQVSGSIPRSWCLLHKVLQLSARDMMFVSGSLPDCLGSMRSMVNLVASNLSQVSGYIPLSFGQMTSMFTVELSNVLQLSGGLLDAGALV